MIEIRKAFPAFDSKRLVEWQDKGYIKKLINKWYVFSEVLVTEPLLLRISNCLHHPSYVSLESALWYLHLIPEAVYSIQAVSTRKTILYQTPLGNFQYRSLKPQLYFGYQVLHQEGMPVLMADMEKALLDYLYLTPRITSLEDMEAMRLNVQELRNRLNWDRLYLYAKVFDSPTLDKKINLLKKLLHADAARN